MHRFYFSRLGLCEEAGELVPATASGAPVVPTPAVEQPKANAPPALAAKAGFVDRALAMVKDKGALAGEIVTLKQTNAAQLTEITTLRTQLAATTTERDTAVGQIAQIQTALDASEKQNKDVQTEATELLASIGVPEARLPKAAKGSGTPEADLDSILEAMKAETDPVAKGRLAAQAGKLREKLAAAGSN